MKYRAGYKYQLAESMGVQTDLRPASNVRARWAELDMNGQLRVREGYAWDGASWTIDRKSNMRGGGIHDALYYLMRNGQLDRKHWREADLEYAKALREDGAWRITAAVDLHVLKIAAGHYARISLKKQVYSAPC